jgi:L-threonylcarbamoyladenylate synthase
VGLESTIVDLSGSGSRPRILRPGGVPRAAIHACLHETDLATGLPDGGISLPRVSGSLEAHYAPRARIQLLPRARMPQALPGCRSPGCLCIGGPLQAAETCMAGDIWQRVMPDDPQDYARKMYAALHDADRAAVSDLLIEDPPHTPPWEAIRDRLTRARNGSQ